MKQIVTTLLMVLLLIPLSIANTPDVGSGVGVVIEPEQFKPLIWMNPDTRVVYHNPADGGTQLIERTNNYAFEGEQIQWDVLVMDKNGAEKIQDVYVTVGLIEQEGNDIQVNCDQDTSFHDGDSIRHFNPRIAEEQLDCFDGDTMKVYTCTLTVETPHSMYGQYWVVGEVEDLSGQIADFDENEYWYFNPVVALAVDGNIAFDNVRPGSASYSNTLRITNDADAESGVLMDMTISGTDFYDPAHSGAKCPETNRIRLNSGGTGHDYTTEGTSNPASSFARSDQTNCDNPAFAESEHDICDDLAQEDQYDAFCYYATNGAYSTANDNKRRDVEGYVGIPYETGEESDRAPIISSTSSADRLDFGASAKEYFAGNVLSPGDDMSITFRLFLPEPCNGESFSDGQIYFWGEAI